MSSSVCLFSSCAHEYGADLPYLSSFSPVDLQSISLFQVTCTLFAISFSPRLPRMGLHLERCELARCGAFKSTTATWYALLRLAMNASAAMAAIETTDDAVVLGEYV